MTETAYPAPIFLVGAECSGTVLLRLMLHNHPQVTWCDEFEYAVDRIDEQGQFPELQAYYDWLATHRIFQSRGFIIDTTLSYPELIQSFLSQQQERHQKPIVGAIVHRHFDQLLQIWPNARFIHIVRDPRDVAQDAVNLGWYGNVWMGVERWLIAEQLWERFASQLPSDRQFNLRYEDLMAEHPTMLNQLCAFVGVAYDVAMLSYTDYTDYELPNPKTCQLWQRQLTPHQIQCIEARVGHWLQQRGYTISKFPQLNLNGRDRLYLRIQSRLARAQFRLKRYGWQLFLQETLTRKLHLTALHRPLQYQLNAIDRRYLKKSWH
ncbi:MAG: sulfotransferase [Spirulina sp. SIO3F2]|nr:sulfotransferase [Spirulina sp. SIO3F2]